MVPSWSGEDGAGLTGDLVSQLRERLEQIAA